MDDRPNYDSSQDEYKYRCPPKTIRGKMLRGITYRRWRLAVELIVNNATCRSWSDLLDKLNRLHRHVASHPAAVETLRNSWLYERRHLG